MINAYEKQCKVKAMKTETSDTHQQKNNNENLLIENDVYLLQTQP